MKIYTKTGDKGQTSLFGGTRVPKYHLRIETYGTVDELNAHLGLLRDQPMKENISKVLLKIQNELFTVGAMLATPTEKAVLKSGKNRLSINTITVDDVIFLEHEIDTMEQSLMPLSNFILPGGHPTVSICHIARCVCRRAERLIVLLHEEEGVDEQLLSYLNRLSDFLFVLARKLSHDNGIEETPWAPSDK